jgi:hypothetical protein
VSEQSDTLSFPPRSEDTTVPFTYAQPTQPPALPHPEAERSTSHHGDTAQGSVPELLGEAYTEWLADRRHSADFGSNAKGAMKRVPVAQHRGTTVTEEAASSMDASAASPSRENSGSAAGTREAKSQRTNAI